MQMSLDTKLAMIQKLEERAKRLRASMWMALYFRMDELRYILAALPYTDEPGHKACRDPEAGGACTPEGGGTEEV